MESMNQITKCHLASNPVAAGPSNLTYQQP